MIAGLIIRYAILEHFDRKIMIHSVVWHGPLETAAFLWAGAVGLRGVRVVMDLVRSGCTGSSLWPSGRDMAGPVLLVLLAAIVEAAVTMILAGHRR